MTTPGKTYIVEDPRIENTAKHRRWIEFAKKKALESDFPGPRMCAAIISGGRLISWGNNRPKSGSLKSKYYTKNQAMHAECSAIQGIDPKLLKGATVYVAGYAARRETSTWSSKCCESCQMLMKAYGIKRVIYHDKNWEPHIWRVN